VAFRVGKKTKKRQKQFEKAKKSISKEKKSKKDGRSKECNLLAIQSLFDPQEFADRLFGMLEQKKVEKFEVRFVFHLTRASASGSTLSYCTLRKSDWSSSGAESRILFFPSSLSHT